MLKMLNNLRPFLEDCYAERNVREYAKHQHISPPTASALLKSLEKESLLLRRTFRNNHLYRANRESRDLVLLSRLYWQQKLKPLTTYLEENLVAPTIILFGSLSRAEARKESDIDLFLQTEQEPPETSRFERRYDREIQIFSGKTLESLKNPELAEEILNGHVLAGELKTWTGRNAAKKVSLKKRTQETE